MGNNANSIPTGGGGGPSFRSNIKHKGNEPDSLPWSGAARRTDSGQNAVKSGEEIGGRTERTTETFHHVGGDGSDGSRKSSSAHERHAVWAPRPSPQNVVGGREALLYHPTIEIQPLTDELLMVELPKYKMNFSNDRSCLPGLSKPYSQFQRGHGTTLVKDVCNKISGLKDAIVSPQVQKKDLPGLGSPFGDFTQEKLKRSELWPSLANTAHFEQYLPKENREPKLIEKVEKDLKQEMIKIQAKQAKEVKRSEETYLVELEKDLMKLTSNNNGDKKEKTDIVHMDDLVKHDLSNDKASTQNEQISKFEGNMKYVWQDNKSILNKCLVTISEKTPKETEKKTDEIDTNLLINFKSEQIMGKKIHQNRIRKIEINLAPEDSVEENSDFSILDETLIDSFEDLTLQEFSELDNSLDRIPDFPKDETEAMDGLSVNEHMSGSHQLTGFESRPFDLTKLSTDIPSAPPFKPKFFKNAIQNIPNKKVGDTKDLTLVEHGYAKKDLGRVNVESSINVVKDQPLDYEHSYVKGESSDETGRNLPHLSSLGPHRCKDDVTTNVETGKVENKKCPEPWSPITKLYGRKEESRNPIKGDNPVGDWVRLENLSKANKNPNFTSSKTTRPF